MTSDGSSLTSPVSSALFAGRRASYSDPVIYCVIPRELEADLFDKMVAYYADNPNVTVIVDRREGVDRRSAQENASFKERRQTRDRRRVRLPGTFPETDAPE